MELPAVTMIWVNVKTSNCLPYLYSHYTSILAHPRNLANIDNPSISWAITYAETVYAKRLNDVSFKGINDFRLCRRKFYSTALQLLVLIPFFILTRVSYELFQNWKRGSKYIQDRCSVCYHCDGLRWPTEAAQKADDGQNSSSHCCSQ